MQYEELTDMAVDVDWMKPFLHWLVMAVQTLWLEENISILLLLLFMTGVTTILRYDVVMGGEMVATDVRDCSNQTTIAGSRTRETQKYLLYENCVEEVLTSVIEIITLPIMATVRPEMMVLYHGESVNSCLDWVVRLVIQSGGGHVMVTISWVGHVMVILSDAGDVMVTQPGVSCLGT